MEVLGNLDGNLLLWIQEFVRQDWMDGFWKWITMLGDSGWFWILLSALLMIPRSTRQVGLTALLALLIGALCTNVLLKNLVARVRPYETVEGLQRLIEAQKDFSFPSGHTCASFAAAFVYWRKMPGKGSAACLVLAGLIACSRLYVGVHYPTDVLAGLCIGIGSACMAVALWERASDVVMKKGKKKEE
ncbi:MAG: phosphatase PAP2 family protein [Ruminococcus sp.]|nr:phosphatase PAP2 family protein [Ruminococcus sp.]